MVDPKPRPKHPFMQKLEAQQKAVYRKILVFGPSGVGKTSLVGSAAFDPRTAPVIVLDFDGGSMSLEGIDPSLLMVRRILDWDDYSEAYDFLLNEKHGFKTLAIDSISETHVFSMLSIVDQEVAESVEKALKEGKKAEEAKRDNDLEIQQNDYGKSMVQIRRFLRNMLGLPMHVVMTALPKTATVPKEGKIQLPAMFGQMAEEVTGMFDITGYLNLEELDMPLPPNAPKGTKPKKKMTRVLSLQNTPGVRVKVRTRFGESSTVPNRIAIGEKDGIKKIFDALKVP